MNVIWPQVYIKRSTRSLRLADELNRAVDKSLGDLFTIHPSNGPVAKIIAAQGMFLGRFTIVRIAQRQQPRSQALEIR